jgi:cytochrome c oxidase assembly factor CtaG
VVALLSPLDTLGDQQLGGLIMWLPTNIPYLIALSVLFFQWVGEHDQAERLAAEELADLGDLEDAGGLTTPFSQ